MAYDLKHETASNRAIGFTLANSVSFRYVLTYSAMQYILFE